MKKSLILSVSIFLWVGSVGTLSAGIVGDINNDGKIDLTEAIYALQVGSNVYPNLPLSCILAGRGPWVAGTNYLSCDVVEHHTCPRTDSV